MIALQPMPDSLDEALARAEAAAQNATAIWLDAVTTHIHELADAAQAAQADAARFAAEVPGSPERFESLGEGGEELELVNWQAMDAQRYAAEARYWLVVYRTAQRRLAAGKPAVAWATDDELAPLRQQVHETRMAMRDAQ